MATTPQRNALQAAYEAAQTLTDMALDAQHLFDIWSRRQPLALAPGQIQEMNNILRDAHAALTEAKEKFNAAVAGERVLRPEQAVQHAA